MSVSFVKYVEPKQAITARTMTSVQEVHAAAQTFSAASSKVRMCRKAACQQLQAALAASALALLLSGAGHACMEHRLQTRASHQLMAHTCGVWVPDPARCSIPADVPGCPWLHLSPRLSAALLPRLQDSALQTTGGGTKQEAALAGPKWRGQYAASWGTQFVVLARRSVFSTLRNPTDAASRLLMSCWVGILAGGALTQPAPDSACIASASAVSAVRCPQRLPCACVLLGAAGKKPAGCSGAPGSARRRATSPALSPVAPIRSPYTSLCMGISQARGSHGACAGLVFLSLPQDNQHAQERLALLFFVLLLYQLLPFCYVRPCLGSCCA